MLVRWDLASSCTAAAASGLARVSNSRSAQSPAVESARGWIPWAGAAVCTAAAPGARRWTQAAISSAGSGQCRQTWPESGPAPLLLRHGGGVGAVGEVGKAAGALHHRPEIFLQAQAGRHSSDAASHPSCPTKSFRRTRRWRLACIRHSVVRDSSLPGIMGLRTPASPASPLLGPS